MLLFQEVRADPARTSFFRSQHSSSVSSVSSVTSVAKKFNEANQLASGPTEDTEPVNTTKAEPRMAANARGYEEGHQ